MGYAPTAQRTQELGIDARAVGDRETLRSTGIDLRAVRDSVASTFGADVWDNALRRSDRRRRRRGHIPFTKSAKKVLELALREALALKDNWIGCEHVDPLQLRGPIIELLDQAA
jgi:hypothetical protein